MFEGVENRKKRELGGRMENMGEEVEVARRRDHLMHPRNRLTYNTRVCMGVCVHLQWTSLTKRNNECDHSQDAGYAADGP